MRSRGLLLVLPLLSLHHRVCRLCICCLLFGCLLSLFALYPKPEHNHSVPTLSECLIRRHQPLTLRGLLLASLLPFEGQNQWLQLQRQLLQPASGVLTRAQRVLLLGYDENQRREEELQRDAWLETLAAASGPEETKTLRQEIKRRLKEQREEDMVSNRTCFQHAELHTCTHRDRRQRGARTQKEADGGEQQAAVDCRKHVEAQSRR